jgi:nitrite reductase (NADH) small subunit
MTTISAPQPTIDAGRERWHDIGPVAAMTPARGAAALVDGRQVAVFVLDDGSVRALDNRDPFSQANVLSRGIVGDRGGVPVVASPVYKQCFALDSGRCLDDPDHHVRAHDARVVDGRIHVRLG